MFYAINCLQVSLLRAGTALYSLLVYFTGVIFLFFFFSPVLILSLACVLVCVLSHSVISDFWWPGGLQSARVLCPWGFSGQEYWSGFPCPPPGTLPEFNKGKGNLKPWTWRCKGLVTSCDIVPSRRQYQCTATVGLLAEWWLIFLTKYPY